VLLSATDDVSGVGEMIVSNRADFADGQWEVFTTRRTWLVPGGGPHTIYVMFRDRAGNQSAVYTATTTP
jgi:hypothetical protein